MGDQLRGFFNESCLSCKNITTKMSFFLKEWNDSNDTEIYIGGLS